MVVQTRIFIGVFRKHENKNISSKNEKKGKKPPTVNCGKLALHCGRAKEQKLRNYLKLTHEDTKYDDYIAVPRNLSVKLAHFFGQRGTLWEKVLPYEFSFSKKTEHAGMFFFNLIFKWHERGVLPHLIFLFHFENFKITNFAISILYFDFWNFWNWAFFFYF